MKKQHLFFLSLLGTLAPLSAEHSGIVFLDANKNGLYDKGEKTLSGIAVSDGLNVVQTDKTGSYNLPGHEKARFIHLTLPSGYETKRFYHPVKGESEKCNFALTPARVSPGKNGSHRFLQITDTEIFNTAGHDDWTNNLKNYADRENASFIVHTGDICYEKGLKAHINLLNSENAPCPVFYCIGNHDLVSGKYGEEVYENLYGPVYYSFDIGNTHYIVTPMLGGDYKPGYTKEDVYRWMKNDLALVPQKKSVIVFNHDLLTTDNRFIYGINDKEQIDLNKHNLKAWLYGHWHINHARKQGDVYTFCTSTLDKGGIDHSTSAFRKISINDKGELSSQLRYTYLKDHLKIASLSGERHPVSPDGSLPVSVNTYHSDAPTAKVTCTVKVDGKKSRTIALSPTTDWNWSGILPASPKWEGKKVTLAIKATYGKDLSATAEETFTYRAPTQSSVKTDSDWNNLLGSPAHTGTAPSPLNPPLALSWVRNVGGNIYLTSPLVSDGKVFTATVDEDLKGQAHVHALDAKTGKMHWSYKVRSSIKNTIVIEGDLVFAQDVNGYLYALDKDKGTLRWEQKMQVKDIPSLIEGLVADKGTVYAGSGSGLSAYEAATGKLLWKNTGWSQREGTTTTISLGDGVLVSGSQWQALFGNDAATGKLLWRADDNGLRNRGASAAIHGDKMYIISDKTFFIMEPRTGKILTKKELPLSVDVTSTPLVTEEEIIFGTALDGLVALDRKTLEEKWRFKTGNALVFTAPYTRSAASTIETSPILAGNVVYVGASDGTFSALDRKTGKLLWRHTTGAPVLGSVALSGNTLFGSDFSGNVYAFTAQ